MILPKLPLKSVLSLGLLLALTGCGCNDDSTLTTLPFAKPAVAGIRSSAPPVPVDPPVQDLAPLRIDVAFVIDDSASMNNGLLGIIPDNDDDERVRTKAAQAIMEQLEARLRTRLEAEWAASGLTPDQYPDVDFAFAVARFEDFGGEFTNPNRRAGDVDDQSFGYGNPFNDMDARPFILNMPILRQNHPQFAARFADSLQREAPGDGNPFYQSGTQIIQVTDAQSAIEALYQCAAPANNDGTFGGFDANGNGSTLDSGAPTSLDPTRNPQTLPGDSGDVPAIGFDLLGEVDPDNEPQFAVTDENGVAVTIPNPAGGADIPSISSGNIGGIGWRECSARFIILSSDIATVAPTDTPPQGDLVPPAILPPPAPTEMVTSSDGDTTPTGDPRDAPRGARTVMLGSFDSGFQIIGGNTNAVPRRIGVADGPIHDGGNGVAPVGAHTVQQTIDALNELDIEVLCIGAPFRGGLDTKPGDTGVNGDIASDIGNKEFDPSDPTVVQADMAPWFYFNAVNRLTSPEITSIAKGGGEALFPAVYNLGTVWPLQLDDLDGSEKTGIKDTVTDDLIERIRDWVETPYLTSPSLKSEQTAAERLVPLPTMLYTFTLELTLPEGGDVVMLQPAGSVFQETLNIPIYYSDEAIPAPVPFEIQDLTQNPIGPQSFFFNVANESVPLPATLLVPFKITAQFTDYDYTGMTPEQQATFQADYQAQVEEYIKARGDGTNPLANATDPFTQAEGTFLVTIRSSNDTGAQIQLVTFVAGSVIINDRSGGGADASDQIGGSGEAFPPPPSDD